MSQEEFYNNRNLYRIRVIIISVFTGLLLLFNGLTTIPKDINYAVIRTFVGVIVFMRILEIGIY